MDEPAEYVDFMAKYKDWVVMKRMGIRMETRPEEVAMHLASIKSSIDNRSFRILGVKTDDLDLISKNIASGKSKAPDSIASALKEISSPDVKKKLRELCGTETGAKFAEIYLLNKVMSDLSYETSVKPEIIAKTFPELKLKLPRGYGKKKSKKDVEE